MVVFNYSGAEINAKVVYYGPALSGKTTNLEYIYKKMPSDSKGKMVSMKTRTDRTLFFDFLPLELGELNGYRTRMLLYTVPGQVYYNATRKLVLKGADAVVFVADSSPSKIEENIESLSNLEENLNEHGLTLDTIPWVMQYNKRDLPDALPTPALAKKLNLLNVPSFEAVATTGQGIYETFQAIAGLLYAQLVEKLKNAHPAGQSNSRP
ncbi:MAG: ADP-ribosylation factor-like protein, partial [Candidatus Krumholzibacteria bacterium]|nr:ADP-ribosylation factor-like protein [Candidatus Krumholzibacteria bacterium]